MQNDIYLSLFNIKINCKPSVKKNLFGFCRGVAFIVD